MSMQLEGILRNLVEIGGTVVFGANIIEFFATRKYIKEGASKEEIKNNSYKLNHFFYYLTLPSREIAYSLLKKKSVCGKI